MADFLIPKTLAESILWTVAYTDQFEYPLQKEEIWQRLLKVSPAKQGTASKKNFESTLKILVKQKKISISKNFYFLPQRQKLVQVRQQRLQTSTQKWQEIKKFIRLVRWIPWLQSVWVTGSLAMMNGQPHQDIDFMIVTQTHRLWMTRFIVTGIAFLMGKKRIPFGSESHTWCLNLWLDEEHLEVPTSKQNVYVAYEVIQAKNVFDRKKNRISTTKRFWQANSWVKNYLANFSLIQKNFSKPRPLSSQPPSFLDKLFNLLEYLSFRFQFLYMQRHLTTEQVAAGYAFFHPRQTAQLVAREWQQRVKKLQ